MRSAVTRLVTTAWAVSRRARVRAFDEATRNPRRAQEAWLARALPSLGGSQRGRQLGLDRATSLEDFRRRAPIVQWDDLAPLVEQLAQGTKAVLTTEPVLVFERTSGSASLPKRIPYTQGLLDDFSAATAPWLDDLFRAFPSLFRARQYWSVSPAARPPETTPGGVRVGFEDDTEYFGPATRVAMKQVMAVPASVARLRDVDRWREETLVHLVEADDLGFISVWNPSFLTLLLEALVARWPALRGRVSASRRRVVDDVLAQGPLEAERVWPKLALVSCWTDAWAAEAVPAMRRFLPRTPVQGKGLLATEGVVSFPLWGQPAPVAAVTSHLLEFEALDDEGRPARFVDELTVGARYQPLLTTRGGLVRYRLPDVVRCVGAFRAAPLLRFEGRLDKTADLRGEKLSAVVVERVLQTVLHGQPVEFSLLAPSLGATPRYTLFLETRLDDAACRALADEVERRLGDEAHYAYCRALGQLGAVSARRVTSGRRRFLEAMTSRGLKLGDIKPTGFDTQPGWEAWFDVA